MRTLVVVKTGWQQSQRMLAYRTFARKGWRLAVVDRMLNQSLRIADVPVVCDLTAIPQAVKTLRGRIGRPDGILTFSDSGLAAAARLAEAFGLPFLPVEIATRATDKREQRRACAAAGLAVPDWRTVADEDEAAATVRDWGRVVIKPADRAAGVAVRLVESAIDATRAYREAAHAARDGAAVLAERYLDGNEVSVESIAVEGRQQAICVTDKITTHGPHFVEVAHTVPSALEAALREAAVEVALSACAAVGLRWGACHTEVKLTEAGPMVVEVNPRLAGDCIVDLVDLSLGLNLYELLGRQAFGEEVTAADLVPRRYGAAAIHFLTSSPGIFLGATSPLEHEPPDWLVELSVTSSSGRRLPEPRSNSDRIGYAIAVGDSGPVAAARARWAIDSVAVRMAREPAPMAAGTGAGPTDS